MFSFDAVGSDYLRPFEVVDADCFGVVLDDEFVGGDGGNGQGRLPHEVRVRSHGQLFCGLTVDAFGEIFTGLDLFFFVVYFGGIFLSLDDLQNEHGVVVDDVQEEHDVDDEGQHVLSGQSLVTFVDLTCVYFSADEDELHHNDGHQIDYSTGIVVEQEQFGLVEDLPALDQSLMFGLDHISLGVVVLHKNLAVVLLFLALLAVVGHLGDSLQSDHSRRRLVVHLVQLYFLEHDLGVVLLAAVAARNKTVAIGFDHGYDHDVSHAGENYAHGRENFAVGVNCSHYQPRNY